MIKICAQRTKKRPLYDPQGEEMSLLACAPNEASDQPAHLRSLTRVFVVRMKNRIIGYPICAQRGSDQTVRMRRVDWNFPGRTCTKVRFLMLWLICATTVKKGPLFATILECEGLHRTACITDWLFASILEWEGPDQTACMHRLIICLYIGMRKSRSDRVYAQTDYLPVYWNKKV